MNFYKHHIGDYDSHTSHLTFVEDAAYSRLIRLYYRSEAPLPLDVSHVCRLVRATTKIEREAVRAVLSEFFTQESDGWHSKRCDEEIQSANKTAAKNRENGKGGGRPRKTETQTVSTGNPEETQTVSAESDSGNLSQTPDSRLQNKTLSPAHDDRHDIPGLSGYHTEDWQPDLDRLEAQLRRAGVPMPDAAPLALSLTRFNLHFAGKPLTETETYSRLVGWLSEDRTREQSRQTRPGTPAGKPAARKLTPVEQAELDKAEFLRQHGIEP